MSGLHKLENVFWPIIHLNLQCLDQMTPAVISCDIQTHKSSCKLLISLQCEFFNASTPFSALQHIHNKATVKFCSTNRLFYICLLHIQTFSKEYAPLRKYIFSSSANIMHVRMYIWLYR